MEKIFKENIEVSLAGIEYKTIEPTGKKVIEASDTFSIVNVTRNTALISIERKLVADVIKPFELIVKAQVGFEALDGVDIINHFTKKYLREHVNELCGVPMSFISALITQITGSFGGFPLITPAIIVQDNK